MHLFVIILQFYFEKSQFHNSIKIYSNQKVGYIECNIISKNIDLIAE